MNISMMEMLTVFSGSDDDPIPGTPRKEHKKM